MRPALVTLKARADFVRIQKSTIKVAAKSLVLCAAESNQKENQSLRVGFTVTKTVGNAVIRNRIRRRLKAVVKDILPTLAVEGVDYVLIGRKSALEREFGGLEKDLKYALHAIRKAVPKNNECLD
jgi:ribonuclease P protein component